MQGLLAHVHMLETAKGAPQRASTSTPASSRHTVAAATPVVATKATAGSAVVPGGSSMVNEWLKRKAEEQRHAARQLLKRAPAPVASADAVGLSGRAGGNTSAAKTQAGGLGHAGGEPAAPAVHGGLGLAIAPVATQAVAGGVIRGKIYKGRLSGLR
jgi:hypothetical protein